MPPRTPNTASTSVDHTVTYDITPPVITIVAPVNGGAYALNQVVAADYSCTGRRRPGFADLCRLGR